METPQLSEQERQQILDQIHQREILEKAAVEQEKKAREAEAERHHRESIAADLRRLEEERKQRLSIGFATCLKLIQEALEAFEQSDEGKSYRLLAKADSLFINVKHQLNQKPQKPSTGSVPTVRVKRDTALGYAVINATDLLPTDIVLEGNE